MHGRIAARGHDRTWKEETGQRHYRKKKQRKDYAVKHDLREAHGEPELSFVPSQYK